jgi:hypothetical protein
VYVSKKEKNVDRQLEGMQGKTDGKNLLVFFLPLWL